METDVQDLAIGIWNKIMVTPEPVCFPNGLSFAVIYGFAEK